ncbi:Eco57I restriction-modification methylase domain-containing protein [Bradyrhizobium sp. SZCCHNR2028]|uniref:Eco57I restriction-modification methylase domain-containing protein n=1 Tax=Bradyrhizobium sp. SZCCHNR2028 TaxID=3057382 RepID=UPI0028E9C198|nr:DNA methyltransferase [Bradyrhizobium sp. SZCCHNR2028]
MTFHSQQDETSEWLNYLQPEGLVVGANVLRETGVTPIRQTPLDTETAARALHLDSEAPREQDRLFELHDAWGFFEQVLDWPAKLVAGSPGGPAVDPALTVTVPEHETLLSPGYALLWNGAAPEGIPAQALVMLHSDLEAERPNQFAPGEWHASPHQRLERLLRESNVGVGILITRNALRLIYAPRGETAGWLTWPLAALGRVEGRPMLAGLKLCLGRNAFFTGAPEHRLRKLLEASREAQNAVSEKLSGQVLGALYELLRGLHRAAPERIEALASSDPHHLYEGLLTLLMRLVFLLYAEDRDLLPSSTDPQLKRLWDTGYSIKTLYARLLVDEALNPDTMDERRGGWGQWLAVFRLIHGGHPHWVTGRGGKLFDPDAFPFLEGRVRGSAPSEAAILPVSDGTILRILHGLMTIEGRGLSGERIRERLSYRSLDVESIGSVYETVMGFTTCPATERMIALRDEKKLPNFIGLDTLLAEKPGDRQKWLKELGIKLSAKQAKGVKDAHDIAALIEAFGALVDERASPKAAPIGEGAPYLQPTEERRRSGSHYTPRSLTEPIVRHALEPAFTRLGPDASPEAVLSLKVCDPACGSGAFLVEACRQIGARLEQAWNMYGAEKPKIPPDEDEALHARRLVAQKCLYGVDRNPMAVDLARLSLWLATLARDHEFTFLDHALKAGDSLVGLTRAQIQAVHWDPSKPGLPLFREMIEKAVGRALEGREAIRNADDGVLITAQAARYLRVVDASEPARVVGDAVIAAHFSADKAKAREQERQTVESWVASQPAKWSLLRGKGDACWCEQGWRPFHWEIEFPEVFVRDCPGFDAVVGNPPFAGKNTIAAASGPEYLPWLQILHEGAHGNADLVAHFFRRAFSLLCEGGAFGLIATNTIGQGDTRATGLAAILNRGGHIYRATKRYQWPNEGASVVVSIVHVLRGAALPVSSNLDGRNVSKISSFLRPNEIEEIPPALATNLNIAFAGEEPGSDLFLFSDKAGAQPMAVAERLLQDTWNQEVIKGYLGADEINDSPTHSAYRYAITFGDLPLRRSTREEWNSGFQQGAKVVSGEVVSPEYEGRVAQDWPNVLDCLIPRRTKAKGKWWQYRRQSKNLKLATKHLHSVFCVGRSATPHLAFARVVNDHVFAKTLAVFSFFGLAPFAVLQSRVHEVWTRFFSSSMKDDLRYAPSDCFETFPFPTNFENDATLEDTGRAYHDHRAALMVAANEGMTKTYNRFHKADERSEPIVRLRELHDEMDCAVLRAYGWDDLAAELRPVFLTEKTEDDHTYQGRYFWSADQRDRVLARLLALNAEQHREEVAAGRAPAAREKDDGAGGMEDEDSGPLFDRD